MPDGPISAPVERLRFEHETHWRHRQGFTVLPGPGCGSAGARPTTVVKGITPTSGFFETGVKVRYVRGIQRDGFINLTISSRLISPRFRSPRCGPARRCGCALRDLSEIWTRPRRHPHGGIRIVSAAVGAIGHPFVMETHCNMGGAGCHIPLSCAQVTKMSTLLRQGPLTSPISSNA